MNVWDIALTEWTVFLVTLFTVLASLSWYWYLAAAVLFGIRPMSIFFG